MRVNVVEFVEKPSFAEERERLGKGEDELRQRECFRVLPERSKKWERFRAQSCGHGCILDDLCVRVGVAEKFPGQISV